MLLLRCLTTTSLMNVTKYLFIFIFQNILLLSCYLVTKNIHNIVMECWCSLLMSPWLIYMGRTCLSRQNWYQYQEHQHYGQINQPHGYLEKANLVLFLFASLVIFCVHMCMWYCKQRKLQYSCLTVNFTFGGKFPVCGSKWLRGLAWCRCGWCRSWLRGRTSARGGEGPPLVYSLVLPPSH